MALETWDDIGSTLEQAESNINQGNIPTQQGFPRATPFGILNDDAENSSRYNDFLQRVANMPNVGYGSDTLSIPTYSINGALQSGYISMIDYMQLSPSEGQLAIGKTVAIPKIAFDGVQGYSVIQHTTNGNEACLFALRIPYYNKANTTELMYKVVVVCSHGKLEDSDGRFFPPTWGLTGLSPYLLYSTYYNYNGSGDSNVGGISRYRLRGGQTNLNKGSIFSDIITDNVRYDAPASVKQNLQRLVNNMLANGCGSPMLLEMSIDLSLSSSARNNSSSTQNLSFSTATSYFYNCCGSSKVIASTLPIWDMSVDCAGDIVNYILHGNVSGTWYKQTEPYTPAVDTNITDTTTQWYVQSVYDTDPIYRINYKCADLGASTKDVRETWRGNIFVDSVWSMDNTTKLVQLTKSQCVLYDRPYTSHKAGISIKWKRIWDLVAKTGVDVGESASAWFQQNNTYTFHLGMCIYTADQISNIVYFTAKYDTTNGLTWGTITDNGDDSEVIFSIVSTSAVDNAGGISNIQRPDADDGYTGVDTSSEEEDYTYNPGGDGDVPTDTITPTSDNGVSVGGKFCTTYQVTTAQLKAISTYFWDDGNDGFMSKYINAVNNPIESILSVGYMPVSVTSGVGSDSIFIGNVNLTAQAPDCLGYTVGDTTRKVVIGELDIPEVYSSFLDYQPYTNLTIFLPYIGFKTLPPNMFMGKKLKVEYAFDLITGACKALLSANGKYIMSFDSDCMIKIPLTASNNSDVFMQRLRSAVEAGVSIMSAGVGSVAITSGGSRTVSGERFGRTNKEAQAGRAMRRVQSWSETSTKEPTEFHSHNYGGVVSQVVGAGLDIAMAKHTYETYGGASSAVASVEPNSVYVIIDSPTVQYPSTYNHNCGKPCELSKYLSSLTGYTEVDGGIDLNGIPCTDAEREEIHSLLVSGVYL